MIALMSLLLLSLPSGAAPPATLFEMARAHPQPARLAQSVLVIVDAQEEYVSGALPLENVQQAVAEIGKVLRRARAAGTPVIHVVHRGGGGLFDPAGPFFAIVASLAPRAGETVIEKRLPNAFAGTELQKAIAATGRTQLIVVGFMTHMCVSSTARAALDHGYATTIIAAATATRALPDGRGGTLSAATVQRAALAALADRFAVVVDDASGISE
ncbi:MAG: cysteine hydrolase family protein [Thiohalomonadaceae bacterium]